METKKNVVVGKDKRGIIEEIFGKSGDRRGKNGENGEGRMGRIRSD